MTLSALSAARNLLAAAAAAALLTGAAGGASAAGHDRAAEYGPGGRELPGNWMVLGVKEGDEAPEDATVRLLRCPPGQDAGHPHADAACATLNAVDGRIADIEPREIACPMIYRPVTALAYGMWNGTHLAYTRTYANECVMKAATGPVFSLDA